MSKKYFFCVEPLISVFCTIAASTIITNSFNSVPVIARNHLSFVFLPQLSIFLFHKSKPTHLLFHSLSPSQLPLPLSLSTLLPRPPSYIPSLFKSCRDSCPVSFFKLNGNGNLLFLWFFIATSINFQMYDLTLIAGSMDIGDIYFHVKW